jgi:methionyl aminopeptidase
MSITQETELLGMQRVSEAVATTLREMRAYAKPGMSTKELDDYGAEILRSFGAKSAPYETYGFPGYTCISVNREVAHGIPSDKKIIQEGDLLNVDVSAELDGFWSDNGGSFVVGEDIQNVQPLVDASKEILRKAVFSIRGGIKINDIGVLIEKEAKQYGFRVIRNLGGHGVGRSLHEHPFDLLNCRDNSDNRRFRKNSVVAIETFITTHSTMAIEQADGFTLLGNKGGFTAQHEHTIMITEGKPVIFTEMNEIWN